ncbi:hypothetical protein ACJRO7_014577 [Eucalyptus globulus]|uniref:Uncharacterized protein n=1 Tax=Eucalyptus globulus TaxID=34317 RepID=A0ABD3L6I9_EUCGL
MERNGGGLSGCFYGERDTERGPRKARRFWQRSDRRERIRERSCSPRNVFGRKGCSPEEDPVRITKEGETPVGFRRGRPLKRQVAESRKVREPRGELRLVLVCGRRLPELEPEGREKKGGAGR